MVRENKYNQKLIDKVFKLNEDLSLTTKQIADLVDLEYGQVNYILYRKHPSVDLVEVIRKEVEEIRRPKTILESFLDFFTLSSKK